MPRKKTVLFYQHFGSKFIFRGAHYKTLDYYNHIKSFFDYEAVIAFDVDSQWGPDIPWFHKFKSMPTLESIGLTPDILFLNSGKDWIKYQAAKQIPEGIPIISPVNHFRALNPSHKSYSLLSKKATRLCPSPELFNAVSKHQLTQGKTVYLPNAVEKVHQDNKQWHEKTTEILIVGIKNPEMAVKLAKTLSNDFKLKVVDRWMCKYDFQETLNNSQITIHLPKEIEAHYIPAIESMLYGSIVIIPDCVGNRSYAKHMDTCVMAEYNLESLLKAVKLALSMGVDEKFSMIKKGQLIVEQFSFDKERIRLLDIFNSLDLG